MRLPRTLALAILAMLCGTATAADTLSHGRFKDVTVYRPNGPIKQFVLFLSGDAGWRGETAVMAETLTAQGSMVAGIDTRRLFADLARGREGCFFPDGDLENLSHYIQAYYRLPTYLTPVLAGYSAGASVAYAVAAQAPAELFSAVLTLGFSPELDITKPLCRGEGVNFRKSVRGKELILLPAGRLPVAWINLTGNEDRICPAGAAQAFIARVPGAEMVILPGIDHYFRDEKRWRPQLEAAFAKATAGRPISLPAPPASLSDIPIVEVPATGNTDLFAVLLSGDGGWAGIDKEVAHALVEHGIPVAGLDSLRYFWSPRTPQGLARDLDRTVRYYAAHWRKSHVLLIGYSQGADVLPFAVNRLPPATRALVAMTALIGLGRTAAFEFHVTNWLGSEAGLPVRPETDRLSSGRTLCLYGKDDTDSLCSELSPAHARVIQLPGGHHFGGDYDGLAELILRQAAATGSARPQSPSSSG
jgi:type IV secretory pathway VirJ component